MRLFARQFLALTRKNYIILWQHPILNLIRAFILPIAYAAFLSVAQLLLGHQNNLGLGTPALVQDLANTFTTGTLVWADSTPSTPTSLFNTSTLMSRITRSFSSDQLSRVVQLASSDAMPDYCPENFNLLSTCWAGVVFNSLPAAAAGQTEAEGRMNYTLRADSGLINVDVTRHNSDYEERFWPLQWAIDSAVIELVTGVTPDTPLELPFTTLTNEQQANQTRLSFISGVYDLIDIAFFVAFLGIVYQAAGSIMQEQNSRLTGHLTAMGCLRSARIVSWHFSLSLLFLPAWIAMGIIWQKRIFWNTSMSTMIGVHILYGFQLTSWTFFAAQPFAASPQLAAIATTFFALLLAIISHIFHFSTVGSCIFEFIFPPAFYIYALRGIALWELAGETTDVLQMSPPQGGGGRNGGGIVLIAVIIVGIINLFLYPFLALWVEQGLYGAHQTKKARKDIAHTTAPSDSETEAGVEHKPEVAIRIDNLHKKFGRGKKGVIAIQDLSLEIARGGIHCLLGSNGSGKSTTLEILAGLLSPTSGTITYSPMSANPTFRPPRGALGIVPQRNVLWDELTSLQHLQLWRAIKRPVGKGGDEDLEQLLRDCDVGGKIRAKAGTLSGGQKRKLQLAIGMVGQSELLLVDEATSGVDPLARRAIWRALNAVKAHKTIMYTTHFLDEADLIGDEITILSAPGKLLAQGSPVKLKSTLGEGYVVTLHPSEVHSADLEKPSSLKISPLVPDLQALAPGLTVIMSPAYVTLQLHTRDPAVVARVLRLIETKKNQNGIAAYDVHASSLEDIFLNLMHREGHAVGPEAEEKVADSLDRQTESAVSAEVLGPTQIVLSEPKPISALAQAWIIVCKRFLILRRSWLLPLLMVTIACCGALIPLFFMNDRDQTCARSFDGEFTVPLYLPDSPVVNPYSAAIFGATPYIAPPTALESLDSTMPITPVQDNGTFINDVSEDRANLTIGGISFAQGSGQETLIAWEADPLSTMGIGLLNLATNVFFNQALNSSGKGVGSGPHIFVNYLSFPPTSFGGTADAIKWVAFFGCAMAVYPAFFTLYTARERRSSVQAMGYSNGLTPLGLWLGHLLFEMPFILIISTVITIVFAKATHQFFNLGVLWVVLTLYGMSSALVAFCFTLFITSALAAFAVVAGYQVIIFLLYTAAYLLTLTYQLNANTNQTLTVVHFTMALLSPVISVVRAAFVSVNLFNLLCDGTGNYSSTGPGDMQKFGGPIVYLILYGLVAFGLLIAADSGRLSLAGLPALIRRGIRMRSTPPTPSRQVGEDVQREAIRVTSSSDALKVLAVQKQFPEMPFPAVDDVSFGVNGEILALLGPNGAGKTTTFNMIRGSLRPNKGDVLIKGTSIIKNRSVARVALGVCPQFNAIDEQLTVRQHLLIYGRLKGLKGKELTSNVEAILDGAQLRIYESRLANKLSGGNQRKLSLAISLIGNPRVVLIDEWSAGVDAATKRQMWNTLRRATAGKAVVLTTHSMEEASALANRVGIIASKMLAIGTVPQLCSRYAVYEIHLSARTAADQAQARQLIATAFSNANQAEDVSTRYEVPLEGRTLADLFEALAEVEARADLGGLEYTVEQLGLESVFLKVVRSEKESHFVGEDGVVPSEVRRRRWRLC